MKMIGYTRLGDMLRACEHATVYMRSNVHTSSGQQLVWRTYQLLVQVESGDNVLYWLLNLGSEPEGVPETDEMSKSRLLHSAAKRIRFMLEKVFNVQPHSAMISYPQDTVLFAGDYDDFMFYNKKTKEFELK